MLLKNYLFIIFTLLTYCVSAQNIDSLRNELNGLTIDTNKVKIYNNLAKAFTKSNLDSAEKYLQRAFVIEEKLNYKPGLQKSWYIYALIEVLRNKPEEAVKKYKLGLNTAEQLNDKQWIALIANDLGATLGQQGRLIEAIDQFQKVLTVSQEIKDTLGVVYALSNISSVHSELGNEKRSYEYLEISGVTGINSDDPYTLALSYSNLGAVAAYNKDTLKALTYEEKALKVGLENDDRYSIFYSYQNIGQYALALKNVKEAKENFYACYELAKQIGDSTFLANSYVNLSEFHFNQKDYKKAINYAEKALKVSLAIEGQGGYLVDIRKQLAKTYAGIGDFGSAYKYLEEYRILNDSLVSKDNRQLIASMEILYKTNEKEKENELLKTQNDEILKQQDTIAAISIFLFIAIIMLVAFGYKTYIGRKENIKLLEQKVEERTKSLKTANASLERFNYVASHDLKEPLRSIVSSTQLLERNLKVDAKNQQFMDFIKRDTKRLYELVNAMILVAKYKQIELNPVEIDLNLSIYKVVKGLNHLLREKNASVEFEQLPIIKADPAIIQLVFRQLIQNAIIFNENKSPLVEITVSETVTEWEINFSDNGIGIKEEFHGKIFEAFKRLHHYDKYSGTGIGLFLVKDLIEMQNGRIEVFSNTNSGSIFKIVLIK